MASEKSSLKILIVGQWMWPWYQEACARALTELGCQVVPFKWFDDFYCWRAGVTEPVYRSQFARLQNRLLFGPILWRINRRLIEVADCEQPDVIWFYNCTHIFPKTVRGLKEELPKTLLVQYSNDNPFGRHAKPDYWRYLKSAIPIFDLHFAYRLINRDDLILAGAKAVHILRSYFIPEEDHCEPLTAGDERFRCDVVFAGHYEPDGRLAALEAIAKAGVKLNLFGGGWDDACVSLSPQSPLYGRFPVAPVVGADYRKAISGAKIALCFLSKINADTYTRRNFQIPAMQTFMLSEYSDDLASLFKQGVEAEYFRSQEELLDKIKYYLAHDDLRQQIAANGFKRVSEDGHDVKSRMKYFLAAVEDTWREKQQAT